MSWLAVACVCLAVMVFLLLFDVHYFIRMFYVMAVGSVKRRTNPKHLLDVTEFSDMVTTNDMDFMCHMNNARYLRIADFARTRLWLENRAWDVVVRLGGQLTAGSTMIRYRRSLQLWDRYKIQSKVVCWDEKAFYVEHRWVRSSDNFLCAIAMLKQTLIKVSPVDVVRELSRESGVDIPDLPMPEDVRLWVEANQISSENLKKEL